MLDNRIRELKEEYRMYVNKWDKKRGKEIKEGHARNMRCITKKELHLCILIRLLLASSTITFLDNLEAVDGFQKLVDPVDKKSYQNEEKK